MIENVLKDGTVKEDLTGYVVRYEDVPDLYDMLERKMKDARNKRIEPTAAVRGRGNS